MENPCKRFLEVLSFWGGLHDESLASSRLCWISSTAVCDVE